MMQYLIAVCALLGICASPAAAVAQESAIVEQLAPLLEAEDARQWRPDLFDRSLIASDSLVRRIAALAAGRIGDFGATPLLVRALDHPDSTTRTAAAFGLGLLRDTAAVQPLIQRLTGLPAIDTATAIESVTAIAKIGGKRAADFFGSVLQGRTTLTQTDPGMVNQLLLESWRLGGDAPVTALLPYTDDTLPGRRWDAIYSLGRLKAPAAVNQMIAALRADDANTRAAAARTLTREFADSAKVAPASLSSLLGRALDDQDPGVRINALRSLGTYEDSLLVPRVTPKADDPFANVRVQLASTLGSLGGAAATASLVRMLKGKGNFALRREALLGLAKANSQTFSGMSADWRSSADWRERVVAAEGWGVAGAKGAPWFTSDRDGRVIAAGLQAWAAEVSGPDRSMIEAARRLLSHPDAGVRSVAADIVARATSPADLAVLTAMYSRATRDSFPDAALSALNAIVAIRHRDAAARARVDREFLAAVPRQANYLLRRWAEDNWPEASGQWGPAYPAATGRSLQDYRDLARAYLVAPDSLARPHVFIDTDQRGVLEVELFGPEAPLTVANFLRLVDRRFFDGNRWHRVVPAFVVQDGDPRGDGFGGPGGAIRDEINRWRYAGKPMLGMALSGPDTGSSQWFINLGPQPHLDGTYTIFGRVVGNIGPLTRITQGDLIRTIKR